jgi:hypothetical protein
MDDFFFDCCMSIDWHRVRDGFIVSGVLVGIAVMWIVSVFGDCIPSKKYLFDLGIRCLRFSALPAVFPM